MARLDPQSYDRDAAASERTLHALGRLHPDRVATYCGLLAKVASIDDDDVTHDLEATIWTIELAGRLSWGRVDCIGQVMAAFPHAETLKPVIAQAKEGCVAERRAWCRRIKQAR